MVLFLESSKKSAFRGCWEGSLRPILTFENEHRRITMAWTCYTCGTKISNKEDTCPKCGGNTAAPQSFYIHWIFGGMLFFLVAYVVGAFVGGTLVEVYVSPSESEILKKAKVKEGEEKPDSIMKLKPEVLKAAKEAAINKAKAKMSPVLRNLIQWFLPMILFFVFGALVGFVSDGKTIWEAAIGSILGQVGGFLLLHYVFDVGIGWLNMGIGIVPGFGLAMLGAWFGEAWQDRRERAV